VLAAGFDARARRETDPASRSEWEIMAQSYRRLAEQADRNALTDTVYEPPPVRIAPQKQAQQQPQTKLEPPEK
jgi:hypothetical protein